jgi:hypothetical protein
MANLIPVHSGSRWEPVQRDAVGGHQRADRSVPDGGPIPDVTYRSSRTPRIVAAAIVSVLALGGTGATVALARSADPSPTIHRAGTGAGAAASHDRGRTSDRGRSGDDRPAEDRQGR